MAILAASTTEPKVGLPHGSHRVPITSQVLGFAFQTQQAVRSLSQYLFLRAYFAVSFVVYYVVFVTQILTSQTYLASRFAAARTASTIKSTYLTIWNSRKLRRLRKRLEFEFFVLILSPSGNNLFLMVFWPGWLLIAAAVWALSIWAT